MPVTWCMPSSPRSPVTAPDAPGRCPGPSRPPGLVERPLGLPRAIRKTPSARRARPPGPGRRPGGGGRLVGGPRRRAASPRRNWWSGGRRASSRRTPATSPGRRPEGRASRRSTDCELDAVRVEGMADGLRDVAAAARPGGRGGRRAESGPTACGSRGGGPLRGHRHHLQARPNVTSEAAGLCLKWGNAVLLRGVIRPSEVEPGGRGRAAGRPRQAGLPADAIGVVDDPAGSPPWPSCGSTAMIDRLIPRGGECADPARRGAATVPTSSTASKTATCTSTPPPTSTWPRRSW